MSCVGLLWLVVGFGDAAAQEPGGQRLPEHRTIRFQHLVTDDGLSQDDVTAIYQDSLGFMWFGTEDGLNRFDGHTFRVFRPTAFDTSGLRHPWIVGLASAGGADLWIATEGGGLNRYDARTESFARPGYVDTPPLSSDLFSLLMARDGRLWVGTRYDGLYQYDLQTGRVVTYKHDSDDRRTLRDNRVTALLEDRRGDIWIGTGKGGITRLDRDTGVMTHFHHDASDPMSLSGNHVTAILEDRDGRIWIGASPGGLSRYLPETENFVRYSHDRGRSRSLGHENVRSLFQDPGGSVWIGTDSGLDRFVESDESFVHYRHDPTDPMSLLAGAVLSMAIDRSGVFWVGTSSGISYFSWNAPPFGHIESIPGDPNSLDHPDVWSIYEDRAGVLWVGTATGLNRIDRESGSVTRHPVDDSDLNALHGGAVMGLYEDRAGNFWVGTRYGALHRFDRASGRVVERFLEDPSDSMSLKSDTPWNLFEDSQGRFWVTSGGRGCLSEMDPGSRTFRSICHDPNDTSTPSYDIAHDMIESRSGDFWLGTWGGGLNRYDPETGMFTSFRHEATDLNSPASDFIIALHEDAEGILWLGLYGAGLDRFDPATGEFRHFTQANSDLPNDIVLAIEGDEAGDLWISTYRGLARLSPKSGRIRKYGVADGIQEFEFNSAASFRSASGELFFGGINGVTAFFPGQIRDNAVAPPVVLTALQIRGQPVAVGKEGPLRESLPFVRALTLDHRNRDVAITFAALHYGNPSGNRYRYVLEGYDDAWRSHGFGRTATYTNLPSGRYTFRVQAANSDGVWNEMGAAMTLTILSPPWRSWWAYSLYGLLAVSLLYGLRQYEMNRLGLKNRLGMERVEAEKLRELDRAKSHFFANVSHEFRTPLTLTLGPLDDLRSGLYGPLPDVVVDQVDMARRNAARVLDLINQILEVARLESGRTPLRARRLDLAAFVGRICQIQAPSARRKAIQLDIHLPDAPLPIFANPEHLEKTLSNLLSNALKFTADGGTVRVTVEDGARTARVAIRDNGPGIPAEELKHVFDRFYRVNESDARMQPGTGIGLALAKELVELHGGRLTATSEEGFGSTFVITLLKGREHLSPEQVLEGEIADVLMTDEPEQAREISTTAATGRDVTNHDVTTVLLVEDNPEVRAYVRGHLEPAYRVIEAGDGEEGLAKVRHHLPDLVLSDVMMPRLNGLALCRAIKSDRDTDFIPVILLTAKAAPEDRVDGLKEYADDYIVKPFSVTELRVRIDNLIESRRRLRVRFADANGTTNLAPPNGSTAVDVDFLKQLREKISAHLDDESFSVERLAQAIGMSRGHLHRRSQELLEQSPSDVIRTMRLERAAHLLEIRAGTVSEVAYAVGFKSVSHFSNVFLGHFACRPSEYPPEPA